MQITNRRYDIDWIRVIAIWLLLIYHSAIGFQPWGMMIGFITTTKPWVPLWTPMALLNIWRIPLLFFVSGMGVYFALQNRTWKQLLIERTSRILIPLLFGFFFIVPIHMYLWQSYYGMERSYFPNAGHLWFLGNIFLYTILFLPLFYYLKRNETGRLTRGLQKVMQSPIAMLFVIGAFVTEVFIIRPYPYEYYVMNSHGFFLGLLAFFFGFCFVLSGEGFWKMIARWVWLFLGIAIILYCLRIFEIQPGTLLSQYLLPVESICWILSVLALGYRYLNKPSKALQYLSQAAYPVYILHMIFLYLGSFLIFKLPISLPLQYFITLLFTVGACYATYEIVRRVKVLRFLFGLKVN